MQVMVCLDTEYLILQTDASMKASRLSLSLSVSSGGRTGEGWDGSISELLG